MNQLKITIIGNSVALRVRPTKSYPKNKNYTYQLNELLHASLPYHSIIIDNKALGASTIYNISLNIDKYINTFPNFYVLNFGVVDASTREVPLWFYRLATSKRDNIIVSFCRFFYRGVIPKIRPFLVRLRARKSWIPRKKFVRLFENLITTLTRETNAKIIVIPINPANDRIENNLPGTRKNHLLYNHIMKSIVEKYPDHYYLDDLTLTPTEDYPDGVHFSLKGHEIIAKKIFNIITHCF